MNYGSLLSVNIIICYRVIQKIQIVHKVHFSKLKS